MTENLRNLLLKINAVFLLVASAGVMAAASMLALLTHWLAVKRNSDLVY